MWKDPIVEAVRAERRAIEREWGDTFEEISRRAREVQEAHRDRISDRRPIELRDDRPSKKATPEG